MGNKSLKIFFEILFWLETSKTGHSADEGWGRKGTSEVNVPSYFPKIPL